MFYIASFSDGFSFTIEECFFVYSYSFLLIESVVIVFMNVTSKVSMNLNPFMSFNRLSKCDSMNALVFVKWFTGFK